MAAAGKGPRNSWGVTLEVPVDGTSNSTPEGMGSGSSLGILQAPSTLHNSAATQGYYLDPRTPQSVNTIPTLSTVGMTPFSTLEQSRLPSLHPESGSCMDVATPTPFQDRQSPHPLFLDKASPRSSFMSSALH